MGDRVAVVAAAVVAAAVARTDKNRHVDQHEAEAGQQGHWSLLGPLCSWASVEDAAHSGGRGFPLIKPFWKCF